MDGEHGVLHILFIGVMIFVAIVVIVACIRVMIGVCVCVCVCVWKFATVTTMVAHEVSLDRPSLSNDEDPENPENEEPSFKSSRDTVSVGFCGKYESADTRDFGTDKNPFERIQQLLLKNQKQMYDCDEEMWNNRDII